MKIEIKHKFTGSIIVSGDYESVKDCLEKNSGSDLSGADLRGADLYGADLRGADLYGAHLSGADLRGSDLSGANLYGANLYGSDLSGANLYGSHLSGADLYGANLYGADLSGAKNYRDSHDVFAESVRRQKVEVFTEAEWAAIAQITIHLLCWDSIKKRYSEVMPHIFKVLADDGFNEWLEFWESL